LNPPARSGAPSINGRDDNQRAEQLKEIPIRVAIHEIADQVGRSKIQIVKIIIEIPRMTSGQMEICPGFALLASRSMTHRQGVP
jgi:hypothetical protein